jgi:flagellin
MALVVNTNLQALNAMRHLERSTSMLGRALERLSSGLRINNAADDAAGLAIATRLGAQVRSLNQAVRNANDGIAYLATAEGALNEVTNIVVRIKELAVQAANGTLGTTDLASIQDEVAALQEEMDRILQNARFGNLSLFTEAANVYTFTTVAFHVGDGDNSGGFDQISVAVTAIDLDAIRTADVTADATGAIAAANAALDAIATARGELGAAQNRLVSTVANLAVAAEKVADARSRILDADFAAETAELTRAQILQQAGIAVLAQANVLPQSALALLRQ